jgi:hypothetical protein
MPHNDARFSRSALIGELGKCWIAKALRTHDAKPQTRMRPMWLTTRSVSFSGSEEIGPGNSRALLRSRRRRLA